MESQIKKIENKKVLDRCLQCEEPFTKSNVFSELGEKEISTSGFCERCFDSFFAIEGVL